MRRTPFALAKDTRARAGVGGLRFQTIKYVAATFLATLAHSAWARPIPIPSNFTLPPLRPTYQDLTYRLPPGEPYKWCPVRGTANQIVEVVPATQTCMDALEEGRLTAVTNLIRAARDLPSCRSAVEKSLSVSNGVSAIYSHLNPTYETNFGTGKGQWDTDKDGRDYGKEFYAMRAFRKCLLSAPTECAATVQLVPFLDLLDLRIVDGKCVSPATFVLPPPSVPWSGQFAALGVVDYDRPQPPLTEPQQVLLRRTHEYHHQVSDWRCDPSLPKPPAGLVADAHTALEASARNEAEHHFFVMKSFSGDVDPKWTTKETCYWARMQDHFHHLWMDAVLQGSWLRSRMAENGHQVAHALMNLRDPRLLVRLPCGKRIRDCPIQSFRQILWQPYPALN